MRTVTLFRAALLTIFVAIQIPASEEYDALVKVLKSGATEEVIRAQINASSAVYDLGVNEIIYLTDLGVSEELIHAIVEHDRRLNSATPAVEPATPVPSAPPSDDQTDDIPPRVISAASADPEAQDVQNTVIYQPVVAPPPEETNVSFFYEALSPYGSWVLVDGVWSWQPTAMVVDRTWRPYCHRGRWVYTDAGWTWHSIYNWGWAPFHYGRWSRHHRFGWIWMPDTLWGPAWVSWRHSTTAIGWAPLPPDAIYDHEFGLHARRPHAGVEMNFGLGQAHFTFVDFNHFDEPRLFSHVFHHAQVINIYQSTTIIQNNYRIENNHLVNHGPSLQHIRDASGHDIVPIKLVDQNVQVGQSIRHGTVQPNQMTVYRPGLAATTPRTPVEVVHHRLDVVRETIRVRREDQKTFFGATNADRHTGPAPRVPARTEARPDAFTPQQPRVPNAAPDRKAGAAQAAQNEAKLKAALAHIKNEETAARGDYADKHKTNESNSSVRNQRQQEETAERNRRAAEADAEKQRGLAEAQRQAAENNRRVKEAAQQQANERAQEAARKRAQEAQQQQDRINQKNLVRQRVEPPPRSVFQPPPVPRAPPPTPRTPQPDMFQGDPRKRR